MQSSGSHPRPTEGGRPPAARTAILALILLLSVIALGLWLVLPGTGHEFSVEAAEDLIRSWGPWGIAASALLMIACALTPLPAEVVALANGMAYGPYWGTLITWGSAMVGASLAFTLSRAMGRPAVLRWVGPRHREKFDACTRDYGAGALFLARLTLFLPFFLVNFACGLASMRWWTFFWVTGLGILPVCALLVMMGDQIDRLLPWSGVLVLLAAAPWVWIVAHRRAGAATLNTKHTDKRAEPNAGTCSSAASDAGRPDQDRQADAN